MSFSLEMGDILSVASRGTLHGQRVINTWWYKLTGLPLTGWAMETNGAAFESIFFETVLSEIMSLQSIQYHLDAVRLQGHHVVAPVAPVKSAILDITTHAGDGTIDEPSLPSTSAVVLKRYSAFAGHKERGRVFVAGIPRSQTLNSALTDAARSDWDVAGGTQRIQLVEIGGTVWTPVIKPLGAMNLTITIEHGNSDKVLRVQRRRELFRGE